MIDRYLGGASLLVELCVIAGLFFSQPEQTALKMPENVTEAVTPKVVKTRVDAVMTDCARRGSTTRVEGSIRNLGSIGVTRVTVQTIWKDELGQVKDTGLVYLVGEGEYLAPGAWMPFVDTTELRGVARCNVRALDWWADD